MNVYVSKIFVNPLAYWTICYVPMLCFKRNFLITLSEEEEIENAYPQGRSSMPVFYFSQWERKRAWEREREIEREIKRERECLPPGQVEYAGVVLLPVGDQEAEVDVPHHAEHSRRQHYITKGRKDWNAPWIGMTIRILFLKKTIRVFTRAYIFLTETFSSLPL